jgi:hypothetical protein
MTFFMIGQAQSGTSRTVCFSGSCSGSRLVGWLQLGLFE